MGQISDHIVVSTTVGSLGVSRAGFGIGLITSHTAAWAERYRRYLSIDAVAVDFATTTVEYAAAAAYFASDPKPQVVGIGRCALPVTQTTKISVTTVTNSATYSLTVAGSVVSFTADASATNDEIIIGLHAALDALAGSTATISGGAGVTVVTFTATAGTHISIAATDDKLKIEENSADPGIATDLTAIKNENGEWYGVYCPFGSELIIKAIDTWVTSNKRVQFASPIDTTIPRDAVGLPATDTAFDLKTAATKRTAILYHNNTGEHAAAAWMGCLFAKDPGKATAAFKTLVGVDAVTLTDTHRANILAKNASYYDLTGGVNVTFEGKTGHGQFIDTTRDLDWVDSEIGVEMFAALVANDKIPYSDAGIRIIAGLLRAVLDRAVAAGVFLSYTVETPTRASQATADVTARRLKNLKWSAVGAGAIHGVTVEGLVTF